MERLAVKCAGDSAAKEKEAAVSPAWSSPRSPFDEVRDRDDEAWLNAMDQVEENETSVASLDASQLLSLLQARISRARTLEDGFALLQYGGARSIDRSVRKGERASEAYSCQMMHSEDLAGLTVRAEAKRAAREVAGMRRVDRESQRWESWLAQEEKEKTKALDIRVSRKTRDEMRMVDKESRLMNQAFRQALQLKEQEQQAKARAAELEAAQKADAEMAHRIKRAHEQEAARRRSLALPPTPGDARRRSSVRIVALNEMKSLRRRSSVLVPGVVNLSDVERDINETRSSAAKLGIEEEDMEKLLSLAEKQMAKTYNSDTDTDHSGSDSDSSGDWDFGQDTSPPKFDSTEKNSEEKLQAEQAKVLQLGLGKLARSASLSRLETTFDETVIEISRPESVRDPEFVPMWGLAQSPGSNNSDSDSDSSSDFWPESIFRPASEFPIFDSDSELDDEEITAVDSNDTEEDGNVANSVQGDDEGGEKYDGEKDEDKEEEEEEGVEEEEEEEEEIVGKKGGEDFSREEKTMISDEQCEPTIAKLSSSEENLPRELVSGKIAACVIVEKSSALMDLGAESEPLRVYREEKETGLFESFDNGVTEESKLIGDVELDHDDCSAPNSDLQITDEQASPLQKEATSLAEPDSPDIEVVTLDEGTEPAKIDSCPCLDETGIVFKELEVGVNDRDSLQRQKNQDKMSQVSAAVDKIEDEEASLNASEKDVDNDASSPNGAQIAGPNPDNMAIIIQCAYRCAKSRYALFLSKRQRQAELEDASAVEIQKIMRSKLVRVHARNAKNAKLVQKVHEEYMNSYKNERLQRAWRGALKSANEKEKVDKQFHEQEIEENTRQRLKKEKEAQRAESLHNAWQRIKPLPENATLDGSDVYYYNPSLVQSEWEQPPGFVDRVEEKRRAEYWSSPANPDELAAYQKAWVRVAGEDRRSVVYYNMLSGDTSDNMPMGFVEPIDVTDEDLAPQDLYVTEGALERANATSDGALAALVFCGLCGEAVADLRCEQCGPRFPYCIACFLASHKHPSLRTHDVIHFRDADEDMPLEYEEPEKPEDEPVNDYNCSECQLAEATLICEQCGDQMCKACFDKLHSIGNRKKHTCSDYNGFLWEEYYDPNTDKCKYFQTETREFTDVCPVELMFGPERREYLLKVAEEKRVAMEQAKLAELKLRVAELNEYREGVIRQEEERRRMQESVNKATSRSRKIAKFIAPSLVKEHVPDPLDDDSINPNARKLGTARRSMVQRNTLSRTNAKALADANYLQKVMMGKSSKRVNQQD